MAVRRAVPESDQWLDDYGEKHREVRFPGIYWASVLLLVIGTVGVLWALPVPAEFARISPFLNWGSTFLMAALIYYFIISIALAIGMLPFVVGVSALQVWLVGSPWPQPRIALLTLAVSLCGLYLGHLSRGGVRAVFRDIQLMMIAPVFLLSNLYRRLGIPF